MKAIKKRKAENYTDQSPNIVSRPQLCNFNFLDKLISDIFSNNISSNKNKQQVIYNFFHSKAFDA